MKNSRKNKQWWKWWFKWWIVADTTILIVILNSEPPQLWFWIVLFLVLILYGTERAINE